MRYEKQIEDIRLETLIFYRLYASLSGNAYVQYRENASSINGKYKTLNSCTNAEACGTN
jgi:hypothetical protein